MRYNTFYVFLRLELKNFEKLIAPSESWGKNTSKSFGDYSFRYILALQTQAEYSMISRSRATPGELTWNASHIFICISGPLLKIYRSVQYENPASCASHFLLFRRNITVSYSYPLFFERVMTIVSGSFELYFVWS